MSTLGIAFSSLSSTPSEIAKSLAAHCLDFGVHYLDAQISGGAVKAEKGQLSIMASGSSEAFAKAQPVLDIAKSAKFNAPITAAALQQFNEAVGMGLGWEDDAAVAKVYATAAGLKLPGDDA